jgi:hypothetical protein
MERKSRKHTVNQLLELLYERFTTEEINQNSKIKKIRDKLFEIKLKTINGGKVKVENSEEISNLMQTG